jgi:hypothetical protein
MEIDEGIILRVLRFVQFQSMLQNIVKRLARLLIVVAMAISCTEFAHIMFNHAPFCFDRPRRALTGTTRSMPHEMCSHPIPKRLFPLPFPTMGSCEIHNWLLQTCISSSLVKFFPTFAREMSATLAMPENLQAHGDSRGAWKRTMQ